MSDYSLSPWGRPKDSGNSATANNNNTGASLTSRAYEYTPCTATYTSYQPQQVTFVKSQPSSSFAYGKAQVATTTYTPATPSHVSMTASTGSITLGSKYNASPAATRQNFLNQTPHVAVEYSSTTSTTPIVKSPPNASNQLSANGNAQNSSNAAQNDNKYNGLPSITARKSYVSMMVENYSAQAHDGSTTTKVKIVEKSQANNPLTASPRGICVSTTPQNQNQNTNQNMNQIQNQNTNQNTPQYTALKKIENRQYSTSQSQSVSPQPRSTSTTTALSASTPSLPTTTLSQASSTSSSPSAPSPRKNTDLSSSSPLASPRSAQQSSSKPGEQGQGEQKSQESRKWRRKHDGSDGGNGDQPVLTADGSSLGPWKLQPQQPLPKKAENALIKGRLYLEQVKKKPSDELIQNRTDRIKMLNNGVPDWVPDQESPVCTFCGKIFTVLIRRVHKKYLILFLFPLFFDSIYWYQFESYSISNWITFVFISIHINFEI